MRKKPSKSPTAAALAPALQPLLPPAPPAAESAVATTAPVPARALAAADAAREARTIEGLSSAVGTRNKDLALLFVTQACWTAPGPKDQTFEQQFGKTLPALQGIAPRDEVEGMLAVQLVAYTTWQWTT